MSIAICRVQKIGSPKDIAGIQIHNRRERDHSNSNPNIDRTRSKNNYSYTVTDKGNFTYDIRANVRIEGSSKPYNALVDERIQEGYKGKKAVRKDAVRCCEVLFTASGDFFDNHPDQTRPFFLDCIKFAVHRFGSKNIFAATVHMDEDTPHMHLDFVPLTRDGRLSAKAVLGGRKEMQQLQDDFYERVGKKYGLQRGSRADLDDPEAEKPRKHLTTRQLKAETAKQLAKQEEKLKKYTQLEVETKEFDLEEKPIPFSKNRVSVLSEELDEVKEQAASYRVNRERIKQLDAESKQIDAARERVRDDARRFESQRRLLAKRQSDMISRETEANLLYREQTELNKIKDEWKDRALAAEAKVQELKSTITQKENEIKELQKSNYRQKEELRKEHQQEIEKRDKISEDLRSQITDLKNQTTDLKKKLDWSVSVLKQLMMALKALLLDHEPDRFKADLTLKQQALVKTLINIAAGETRNMGRPEDSDEIKNRAVITKPVFDAIQKQIERDLKQEARLKEMESPKPQIDPPIRRR